MEILHKEIKRIDVTFGQIRTHKKLKESFTYPLVQSVRVNLFTVGDPEQAGEDPVLAVENFVQKHLKLSGLW